MKYALLFVTSFLIFISYSCKKNTELNNSECSILKNALLSYDKNPLKEEFSRLTKDLNPVSTTNDNIGHKENFNTLIHRINDCKALSSELLCYACIQTLPAQTEIKITIDSSGISVIRILDFSTPDDSNIEFKRIHEK